MNGRRDYAQGTLDDKIARAETCPPRPNAKCFCSAKRANAHERGTHAELMARRGVDHAMVLRQAASGGMDLDALELRE